MTRVVCVVQSRFGSARLPGKAMKPLAGRQMLAHVLERAQRVPGVDAVVLATSINENNDPLTWLADDAGVPWYRGDEHDVLGRFACVAALQGADVVMRITGDCPLLDPDVCGREVLDWFLTHPEAADYASNDTTCSGYPDGTDCEVFTRAALLEADRHATSHADREHVTPWMRRHLRTQTMHTATRYGAMKLSVDSPEDLERVRRVFGHLDDGNTSLASTAAAWRRAGL